jgi:hypothetical protein
MKKKVSIVYEGKPGGDGVQVSYGKMAVQLIRPGKQHTHDCELSFEN